MKTILPSLAVCVLLSPLAVVGACGRHEDAGGPAAAPKGGTTTERSAPLYGGADSGLGLWLGGNVRICWNPIPAAQGDHVILPGDINWGAGGSDDVIRFRMREAIEDSWARVANIHFSGWDRCAASGETGIQIQFYQDDLVGGKSDSHNHVPVNVWLGRNPFYGFYNRAQTVHEIGHAIGWIHEQQRPDGFDAAGNPLPFECPAHDGGDGPYYSQFGKYFTPYDPASIMSYCNQDGIFGEMSALDAIGARAAYGAPTAPSCQVLSDKYGMGAAAGAGFAPPSLQLMFKQLACATEPNSSDTCQKISDMFGARGSNPTGFISSEASSYWTGNGCSGHLPRIATPPCQLASDAYGIVKRAGTSGTYGSAPPEVRAWVDAQGCQTSPRYPDICQHMSDRFGLEGFEGHQEPPHTTIDAGWAPAAVATWFEDRECRTAPKATDRCQLVADLYGIRSGESFGFAPAEARTFWAAQGCSATATSPNACQSASELYGITGNATPGSDAAEWGIAPPVSNPGVDTDVRTWWRASGRCTTRPASADTCQMVSDTFGLIPGVGPGTASPDIVSWFSSRGCFTHSRYDADGPRPVIKGDFDGDLRSDIALPGIGNWGALPVAWSAGDGTFFGTSYQGPAGSGIVDFMVAASAPHVTAVAGDFFGDGRADVALTGGIGWATVWFAASRGDGTFFPFDTGPSLGIGDFAANAAVDGAQAVSGDFNGDGRTDILLIGGGSPAFSIPFAFTSGPRNAANFVNSFLSTDDNRFFVWAQTAGVKAVAGDFNGDGKDDLALTGGAGWGSVPVAFSPASGMVLHVTNLPLDSFPGLAATAGARPLAGDFDGDGRGDIALVGASDWTNVKLASSNGDGSFTSSTVETDNSDFLAWAATAGVKPVTGDFDGNGKADIALTGPAGWASIPVAFSSSTTGGFHVTNAGDANVSTPQGITTAVFDQLSANATAQVVSGTSSK